MTTLRNLQSAFLHDVYSGEKTSTVFLTDGASGDARRLNIYRNNMLFGLEDALTRVFSVVKKLVGEDFFKTLARDYIAAHPQHSGDRHTFGHALAAFLGAYGYVQEWPYIAEMATLEWALFEAEIAADAEALSFEDIMAVLGDDEARVSVHPSVRWFETAYDLMPLWEAHQHDTMPDSLHIEAKTQVLLVARAPDFDVYTYPLSLSMQIFLGSLNAPLAQALGQALETALDPAAFQHEFAQLIARGVLVK
jgi:uncharacterized protein